jgi:hypothetical protein
MSSSTSIFNLSYFAWMLGIQRIRLRAVPGTSQTNPSDLPNSLGDAFARNQASCDQLRVFGKNALFDPLQA